MIGVYSALAGPYLAALGVITMLVFLPMVAWPVQWARVLGWTVPDQTDLVVYYGRCLGCVALVLGGGALCAAAQPALRPFYFGVALANFVLMVVVHGYGAWRRIQPASETREIAMWAALACATLLFWPR